MYACMNYECMYLCVHVCLWVCMHARKVLFEKRQYWRERVIYQIYMLRVCGCPCGSRKNNLMR
jgi:hypothetical protein